MRKRNIFYITFFLGFILLVFRNWFFVPQIIGGDWPYIFEETLKNYSFYFSSWNPFQGNGFGGISPFYSLGVFHGFTVFLSQTFHISWPVIYKFFWFGLFIGLSVFSSMYLLKTVLPQVKFWQQILASTIFVANTYILMVVSGGQMGVALAYSIAPLVLGSFMTLIVNLASVQLNFKFQISNFKLSVLAGLVLAVQVMFDPRIAYLTMIAVVIYLVSNITRGMQNIFFLLLYSIVIPIGITILLHAAWILPILFLQSSPISQGLTSVAGFSFFSFADFSHTLSSLHPNWPENVFGKTYFLKPEFLILPILAYSSLLFIKSNIKYQISNIRIKDQKYSNNLAIKQFGNKTIIFFALLGLIGAFLAKGVNPPFGGINTFFFEHIPGINMFRDPTKFYLLVALPYSVLIPFSIYCIYGWLNLKVKNQSAKLQFKIQNYSLIILLLFFVGYWVFLIRPAIFGQLGGTFREREVPFEYVELKDFLHSQPEFFRTLWIPRQHRFAYYSLTHLPVEAQPLFKKAKIIDIINELRKPGAEEYLSELGVKYIIVPDDPNGEIFVKDRKYNEIQYLKAIEQLGRIPWLVRSRQFEKIAVFEAKGSPRDHFWLEGKGKITYSTDDITHYSINVEINSPQKLIFSENFHPKWQLILNDRVINAEKTDEGLNSFLLNKGNYQGNIVFSGDKYYSYGKIISLGTVVLIAVFLFAIHRGKVYNT